jgi:predicted  nucleic acid-binding Zn ribbon protein
MYVCQLTFDCLDQVALDEGQSAISALMDEYRYNGQVIGREFPVILTGEQFQVVFVCPEQDSLAVANNNVEVTKAFEQVTLVGLSLPSFELKGLESQSDFVDLCQVPKALILYSTFVQSCSPVRCFEHFSPVPLYKLPQSVRKDLVKWQESYAACDQLQMNSLHEVEVAMVGQMSDWHSELNKQGRQLMAQIQEALNVPVYQYLYRVGGESLHSEQQRRCPSCGGDWTLPIAMHQIFDFKCDDCGLVSNISWDHQ